MSIKKFNEFKSLNETASNFDEQLEVGIKIETEHNDVYEYLKKYLDSKNVEMPFNKKEFYGMIARAHIKEIPDYYDRLVKMEKDK